MSKKSRKIRRKRQKKGKLMSNQNGDTKVNGVLSDEEFEQLIADHDKGGAFKQVASVRQGCWDAGIEILNSCEHMKNC